MPDRRGRRTRRATAGEAIGALAVHGRRVRSRLARSAPARRAAVVRLAAAAVVVTVAAVTSGSASRAAALRDRWETGREVVVARHRLQVGDRITDDDVDVQRRPAALVPEGALRELHRPVVVTTDIAGGEPVLQMRVGDTVAGSGAVPAGRSAMEISLAAPMPAVSAGDRVDVLASPTVGDPWGDPVGPVSASPTDHAPEAIVVARSAIVIDVADDATANGSITVAVASEDVASTAAALLAGPVAVVLRPPA